MVPLVKWILIVSVLPNKPAQYASMRSQYLKHLCVLIHIRIKGEVVTVKLV